MTDFPSKRATLTTEEAREATSLLRAAGLGSVLVELSGRNPIARTQIIYRAAEGLSQTSSFDGTPAGFRKLVGAPVDKAALESWRQEIVEARQTQRPSRPESF